MFHQSKFAFVVFRALDAVVTAQSRQVFGSLRLLKLLQVLGGLEVGLDLVEISAQSQHCPFRDSGHVACAHLVFRRVLVIVLLFVTPILNAKSPSCILRMGRGAMRFGSGLEEVV